ncbi:MAG: ABC transporter ATP-binding protein [Myxococcales bacterium]|nr:MAG: ABC transporter ATP-binding protein [Myxococcales bacterium]
MALSLRGWRNLKLRGKKHSDQNVIDSPRASIPVYAQQLALSAFHQKNALKRSWAFLELDRGDITVVVIYGITMGLFSLAVPIAVQSLVNTVAFTGLRQPLLVLSTLLAVALGIWAALRALQLRVVEMLQRRLFVRIVAEINTRLVRVKSGAFQTRNGPELLNRFFDVFLAQKSVANLLTDGLDAALIVVVGLTVLAFYHPWLLGFDLILVVTAVYVFSFLGRGGIQSGISESKAKYAVAGWLEEMARHPVLFKLDASRDFAQKRSHTLALDYLQKRDSHFRVVFRQFVGALSIQVFASVTLLAIGGLLVMNKQLTIGQLVAAELIVTAVLISIAKLGRKVETFYDFLASVDKMGELLDLPLEDSVGDSELIFDTDRPVLATEGLQLQKNIEKVCTLTFAVGQNESVHVHGLGEQAATALGDALFGLSPVKHGILEFGGRDVRDISVDALRRKVAVVRDAEALPGSIRDNMCAADATLSSEDIWELLDAVGLKNDIRHLPQGLHTELGPKGAPLSYGQLLRLTLARVLVGHPVLVILDQVFDRLPPDAQTALASSLPQFSNLSILALSEQPLLYTWCDRSIDFSEESVDV